MQSYSLPQRGKAYKPFITAGIVLALLSSGLLLWCSIQHYFIIRAVILTGEVTAGQTELLTVFTVLLWVCVPLLSLYFLILIFVLLFDNIFPPEIKHATSSNFLFWIPFLIILICIFISLAAPDSDTTVYDALTTNYRQQYLEPIIAEQFQGGRYCSAPGPLSRKRVAHIVLKTDLQWKVEWENGILSMSQRPKLANDLLSWYFTKDERPPHKEFPAISFPPKFNKLPKEPPQGVILEWETTYASGRQIRLNDLDYKNSVPEYIRRVNFLAVDLETRCVKGQTYVDGGHASRPSQGPGVHFYSERTGPRPDWDKCTAAIDSLLEPAGK